MKIINDNEDVAIGSISPALSINRYPSCRSISMLLPGTSTPILILGRELSSDAIRVTRQAKQIPIVGLIGS